MPLPPRRSHWLHETIARFRSDWLLKTLGVTAGITLFMVGYFTLLRHPAYPVRIMPLTGLDRLVGFAPWSVVLYASLWAYISLVPGLLGWRELPRYLVAVFLLSLIGFIFFYFCPTAVPPPDIDWSLHPSVAFLKKVDAAGNACPSLHVSFAVLSALWLDRLFTGLRAPCWCRGLNLLWCLGIVYSTLSVKQHVALDVYAGAVLGAAVALPLLFWRPPYLAPTPD